MKNKGFTLVELLAAIVVIGLLSAIVSTKVIDLIRSSENTLNDQQVNKIIEATKKYMVENSNLLPDENDELGIKITTEQLISYGSIENDIVINPKTKERIFGCVNVRYSKNYNQYTYEYTEGCMRVGEKTTFDYAKKTEIFKAPITGYYKLEVWGAQGGLALQNNELRTDSLGYGGYSTGVIKLNINETIYITVGGQGGNGVAMTNSLGGYNGGGLGTHDGSDDETSGGGGGATHIAYSPGLLKDFENNRKDVIIVAGGGGGTSFKYTAGSGGGFKGGTNDTTNSNEVSQTTGYSFGQGQDASGTADSDGVGGGGGGWYGGYMNNVKYKSCGSGGSGYIGFYKLTNKVMYCYNCAESSEVSTKTISTMNSSITPTSNYAKQGNGYAIITYLGSSIE